MMKYLDPPLYQPSNGEPLISSCSQIHTLRVNHLDLSADLAEGKMVLHFANKLAFWVQIPL